MPYKGALLLRRGPAPQQWQQSGPIWVRRALDKCTRGETDPQKRCPLVPGPSEAKKRPQTATLLRLGNSHPIYVGDSHPGIHHPLPPLSSSFLIYPPLKSSLSAFPPPSPIFTPLPPMFPFTRTFSPRPSSSSAHLRTFQFRAPGVAPRASLSLSRLKRAYAWS